MTYKLCLKKDCFYNVWPGHVYCLKHGRYVVFDATEDGSGTPHRTNTAAVERKPKATPTRDKEKETK